MKKKTKNNTLYIHLLLANEIVKTLYCLLPKEKANKILSFLLANGFDNMALVPT